MKPRIYRRAENWWVIRFTESKTRLPGSVFADSWKEAVDLLVFGYRQGYICTDFQTPASVTVAEGVGCEA